MKVQEMIDVLSRIPKNADIRIYACGNGVQKIQSVTYEPVGVDDEIVYEVFVNGDEYQ